MEHVVVQLPEMIKETQNVGGRRLVPVLRLRLMGMCVRVKWRCIANWVMALLKWPLL